MNNIVKHYLHSIPVIFSVFFFTIICCYIQHSQAEEMLPSLTITPIAALSFGTFSVDNSGGSIVVDARSGVCTPTGSVVMLQNICERGQFEIQGQPEAQILVEFLAGDAAQNAQLKNLTLYPSGVMRLGLDGKARVQIGGELVTSGSSRAVSVNANYMVNVNYLQ